ncbi:MAG: hypothetical protein K8J31_02000, partial [Anaerolineae bacterium]|nr:hypothetical protein [Anaerolineae bacterium]
MLLAMTHKLTHPPDRLARCPTCDTRTRFQYAGEQHWPARVAQAAGIEPVTRLWHCDRCHTTV